MSSETAGSASITSAVHSISRIRVRQLFGVFDYDLARPEAPASGSDLDSLLILYGDNGSGKTTILKLVYHLLSSEPDEGHRSFVRSIPFLEFKVEMGAGTYVYAERKNAVAGAFDATIVRDGRQVIRARFEENKDPALASLSDTAMYRYATSRVLKWQGGDDKNEAFCKHLAELGSRLTYLSDDRRVGGEDAKSTSGGGLVETYRLYYSPAAVDASEAKLTPVQVAVHTAEEWLRRQSLGAVDRGSLNANQVYAQVVEGIVGIGEESGSLTQVSFDALRQQVHVLSERNAGFARFGLTAPLQTKRLEAALARARPEHIVTLQRVLKPYLDGIAARLDALDAIQRLVSTLVDHVNHTFFRPHTKALFYDLQRGFQVVAANRKPLEVTQLSSGERQLILLLCTIVASHDRPTIMLIDEPEISLNVKWQRSLLSAMLDCLKGTRSQLIVASHSMELIARYRHSVATFVPLGESDAKRD